MKFEIVSKYADADLSLPVRKTKTSAGYDFQVAEDTIIPGYESLMEQLWAAQDTALDARFKGSVSIELLDKIIRPKTLTEVAELTKKTGIKPTLVPTGIKCEMPEDFYLELSVRSSCPLKHWLILANGVGIIDSDYYNNPDNEGHIFFQVINLSPFDIILKKGDTIGQGILKKYFVTDNDVAYGERAGGFGSTDTIVDTFNEIGNPHILTTDEWYQLGINLFQPEEECVMACNPERRAFVVNSSKTYTTENCDVEYSRT